jgi:hypothetical protein
VNIQTLKYRGIKMAVTINDKEYDETKFDDNTRNSIFQVQNSQGAIIRLKSEILNHQVLITHHNQVIRDSIADSESPTEPEDTK